MDYLNRCLLLGRYRSITIIDDNISCLVIVINDEDGDLTIPIITSTDVAKKIISNNLCKYDYYIIICDDDTMPNKLSLKTAITTPVFFFSFSFSLDF